MATVQVFEPQSEAGDSLPVAKYARKPRLAAVAFLVCAAGVVWQGADRVPCGPASGESLHGPRALPLEGRKKFRIGTFNIHGGRGTDGIVDLDRTAGLVGNLDVVGLNEVQGVGFGGGANQAERLAAQLDCRDLFAPTERRWWHDHFGNGLLARCPAGPWLRIPLPSTQGKGFRNAVLVTIKPGTRRINLLVTHIDRTRDREAQLAAISGLFLSLAEPAILMGDLNSTADDSQIQFLLGVTGVQDALRGAGKNIAPERIDWIFARGLNVVTAGVVPNDASDHPLVWAEFETPEKVDAPLAAAESPQPR